MWKKISILILFAAGIQLGLFSAAGHASEYADTPTEQADGMFIPKQLTFVENMPYYVIPNTLLNQPEGSFAPQTVEVVEAEVHWATSGNWWKIKTDIGDRWVKTAPWQIEVPPPPTLRLMSETPLYARPSEAGGKTAALSPQEVAVVDAEKSWFRQAEGEYNPKRWIKIRTTWLGDQWVHLHLDEIGNLLPLDRQVFYPSIYYNSTPHVDYVSYQYEGYLTSIFVHQTAKFRSLLGSSYQFETAQGPKWAFGPGMPIVPDKQLLKRKQPSPLFVYPDEYSEIAATVPAGELTVTETATDPEAWWGSERWYHVKTDQAEGWFSPTYAEPEDAVDDTASLVLKASVTSIYRFPNTRISLNNGQIGPQTVQPLAAWTAPDGTRWYKISSFVGQGWIQLNPYLDGVVLKDRDQDIQVRSKRSYQGVFYQNEAGEFTHGSDTIGRIMDGEPAFRSDFVASLYHYERIGPDAEGWWTFKHANGYAVQVKDGELAVKTFWDSQPAGVVTLTEAPVKDRDSKQEALLLSLTHLRTLFGITAAYNDKVAYGDKHVTLSTLEHEISGFDLPKTADAGKLHLSGLLYEDLYMDEKEIGPKLQIMVKHREAADAASSVQLAQINHLYKLGYQSGLADIGLDVPLKPGINPLTIQFKVGERIVLQRDWEVTAAGG
ncbi:hypothetical protein SAMN02799630_01000 [Paenibacillus sp. UNCCL117]|uniref:hypothetical protein n=1 Tax=unclassified Paenibacillus TaxID=185978 RepID=UPI000890D88B|nr:MULTISPECIES: hypothetical protein [unclassified Paenibacillus]SDC28080.1 hypothetical protein SAMN04488602_101802 [Paenibacillus sp. cl123]SFW20471.1 hypothetical protein SAMN02799630_01000 [Paenibacillus sp. UNCCL117]